MTPEAQLAAWAANGQLAAAALVYLRVQGVIIALPVFGTRQLSVRVKVAIALALTPLFLTGAAVSGSTIHLAMMAGAELVIGLATGLLVRMLAASLDIAAAAMAQSASLSQLMGVGDEHSPHPLGNLMNLAGMAVLMAMGLPVVLCQLLSDSFILSPVGHLPDISVLWNVTVGVVRDGFMLAMMLASPMILGGFLFQALSGVVARVMPSLPVVFIAAPGAVMLALAALTVVAPVVLKLWGSHVLSLPFGALP